MLLRVPTDEQTPTHEQIALRAYHLWEQAGRPQGRDKEHWQKAERQLKEIHQQEERALRHWEKATGLRAKQRNGKI